jgi:Lytic transglycolase
VIASAIAVVLLVASIAGEPRPAAPALGTVGHDQEQRTSRPAHNALRGVASWMPAPSGTAAAGPALRRALGVHWRYQRVTVTAGGRSVVVLLNDWCACPRRLIDLSAGSFARLAPLSRGLVVVTIR